MMIDKLKNSPKLLLIIILVILTILAIVLGIVKVNSAKKTNTDEVISDIDNKEEIEVEIEDESVFEENIQEIVDETEENNENVDPKYFIKVNYGQNVVTIYIKDENGKYTVPYKAMVCSTGKATPRSGTYAIPSGTYSRGTWGMMVGGVWAQYYTRIKGSILFHSVPYFTREKNNLEYLEYDKLGTTASAGCIRLTVQDAKWIYNNCLAGTNVEFYSDSNPGPLGKPTAQKISEEEAVRGWDPTDPDKNNPWKTYNPEQKIENNETTIPNTPNEETQIPSEGGEKGEQAPGTVEGENPGEQEPGDEEEKNPGEQEPGTGDGENSEGQEPGTEEEKNPGEQEPGTEEEKNPGEQEPGTGDGENSEGQEPGIGAGENSEGQEPGTGEEKNPGETENDLEKGQNK